MSILSLLLGGVLVATFRYWSKSDSGKKDHDLIKSIGLLALVVGILGQLIGLFSAFQAIEEAGSVSSGIVAGGLKISSITTMYGLTIYAISLVLWMISGKLKS